MLPKKYIGLGSGAVSKDALVTLAIVSFEHITRHFPVAYRVNIQDGVDEQYHCLLLGIWLGTTR